MTERGKQTDGKGGEGLETKDSKEQRGKVRRKSRGGGESDNQRQKERSREKEVNDRKKTNACKKKRKRKKRGTGKAIKPGFNKSA